MALDTLSGVRSEMARLYRLGLNGKIRSDEMTRFIYVLSSNAKVGSVARGSGRMGCRDIPWLEDSTDSGAADQKLYSLMDRLLDRALCFGGMLCSGR